MSISPNSNPNCINAGTTAVLFRDRKCSMHPTELSEGGALADFFIVWPKYQQK
jgi:hypothetical protein